MNEVFGEVVTAEFKEAMSEAVSEFDAPSDRVESKSKCVTDRGVDFVQVLK